MLAALVSAILWNLLTWFLGFPSSSSHALIGGIIGAVTVGAGWQEIEMQGLWKILIPLFTSPLIGFVVGFLLLKLIIAMSWDATPRINAAVQAQPDRDRASPWRSAMAPTTRRRPWASSRWRWSPAVT